MHSPSMQMCRSQSHILEGRCRHTSSDALRYNCLADITAVNPRWKRVIEAVEQRDFPGRKRRGAVPGCDGTDNSLSVIHGNPAREFRHRSMAARCACRQRSAGTAARWALAALCKGGSEDGYVDVLGRDARAIRRLPGISMARPNAIAFAQAMSRSAITPSSALPFRTLIAGRRHWRVAGDLFTPRGGLSSALSEMRRVLSTDDLLGARICAAILCRSTPPVQSKRGRRSGN